MRSGNYGVSDTEIGDPFDFIQLEEAPPKEDDTAYLHMVKEITTLVISRALRTQVALLRRFFFKSAKTIKIY